MKEESSTLSVVNSWKKGKVIADKWVDEMELRLKGSSECQSLFMDNKGHVENESLHKCLSKENPRSVEAIERNFSVSFWVSGARRVLDVSER